ncbi:MAG TPA: enoyl-CoA hydratase/isomerase family protein [Victivallales bacterium]|nr:enoyl-CoA hydratase/isomerase family protein [Victivallales bacterium]
MCEQPVLFTLKPIVTKDKFIGFIHLNSPKSFNALTLEMIELMNYQLPKWINDDSIVAIFMDGEGDKAFCAGGDVKSLYDSKIETPDGIKNPQAVKFFDKEYTLDLTLHTFPKPIICWGHGVVMGGGVGLLTACAHRIVTEKSRISMPEITIGLYPDVGGSWFLNQMPGRIGLFLGLTGAIINAHDAIYTGVASKFINNNLKEIVIQNLLGLSQQQIEHGAISNMLKIQEIESINNLPKSELKQNFDIINGLTDFENLHGIYNSIINKCKLYNNEWLELAGNTLESGCPMTAHIVYEQLKIAKYLSLEEIFNMERKISQCCVERSDFYEGVRALLIDKDKKPSWTQNHINEIDSEMINSFFEVF